MWHHRWAEYAACVGIAAQNTEIAAILQLGRHDTAIAMAMARLAADPTDEPACVLAMRALAAADRNAAALAVFDRHSTALRIEFGAAPGPQAGALADRIARGDTGATPARLAAALPARRASTCPVRRTVHANPAVRHIR